MAGLQILGLLLSGLVDRQRVLVLKSGAVCVCVSMHTPCTLPSRHPLLEESLKQYFADNTTPAHLKMADVPGEDTTRLIPCTCDGGTPGPFPLVAVRNVFVLPGGFRV